MFFLESKSHECVVACNSYARDSHGRMICTLDIICMAVTARQKPTPCSTPIRQRAARSTRAVHDAAGALQNVLELAKCPATL